MPHSVVVHRLQFLQGADANRAVVKPSVAVLERRVGLGRLIDVAGGIASAAVRQGTTLTGLFGYLIHKKAATALLNGTSVFPLRHQIDVAMSMHPWPRGSRWAVMSEGSLIISPKSEVGKCDTDVQTLGSPKVEAHERMPNQMLRM